MTHDRDYYRCLSDRLLIEAGLDSGDELAVALAERVDDLTLGTSPDELYREIREQEHRVEFYKELTEQLQNELDATEEDD